MSTDDGKPLPWWATQDWSTEGDREFEEFLNVSPPHQQELLSWLPPLIDRGRQRARKRDAQERLGPLLGCIIANAIVAMDWSDHGRVFYSRDKNRYRGGSIYKPDWLFSKQLIGTIDSLTAAGFLTPRIGLNVPNATKPIQSTFAATPALVEGLRARGITSADAILDEESKPVIRLTQTSGKYLEYDPREVREKSEALKAYNRFLRQFEIALQDSAGAISRLEATPLHRIYSRGSWSHGGRFYGGSWQNLPSARRAYLRIAGQPTIELDYSTFVPRALYHQKGIDYRDDAYAAPELVDAFEAAGIPWADGRPIAKEVFFLMLNSKSRQGLHTSKAVKALPHTITPMEAIDALTRHNSDIADYFHSEHGLELMNAESEICDAILRQGMDDGVPILPVHDSFIVMYQHHNWLQDSMSSRYEARYGFSPLIK